ncbi:MAG: Gfo/Idh/MocA family protein [Erysipelotrichaceae bacterium]
MLKIGIIGCGKITEVRHAPEYHENPNSKIVAFYDSRKERAVALAEKYGAKVCDSIEELLAMDIDAVSVCVANVAHASISIQALEAKKHVLCEKPMAITIEECELMIKAAKNNGVQLMIGHNQRFAGAHKKAHQLIKNNEIGKILSFRTVFGHPGPEGWTGEKNSWFFDKKLAHFGAMADLGVHKTDLIHYLLDDKIVEVISAIKTLDKCLPNGEPISVDDNSYCIYKTENGVVGTMHVSWTFYGQEDNSTVIYGTEGIIKCYSDPEYSLIVEKKNGEVEKFQLDQMTSNEEQTNDGRVNTGVIDGFVDAIVNNKEVPVTGTEASKAMRVVIAAEESANKNSLVKVNY